MGGLRRTNRSPLLDVIILALFVLALMCACEFARAQSPIPDAPGVKAEKRAFWVATGIDYAATFADAAISSRSHFERGVSICRETDPIYGNGFPSTRRLWLQMSAQTTGIALVSYFLKRHHHGWFVLLPTGDAMVHGVGAATTAARCF